MNMNKFLGLDSFRKRPDGSEMTHFEQYSTIVKAIGLPKLKHLIPATLEELKKALENGDEHLNSIPLKLWDSRHYSVKSLAGLVIGERTDYKTISYTWSLSQSVCVLKTAAKMWVEEDGKSTLKGDA